MGNASCSNKAQCTPDAVAPHAERVCMEVHTCKCMYSMVHCIMLELCLPLGCMFGAISGAWVVGLTRYHKVFMALMSRHPVHGQRSCLAFWALCTVGEPSCGSVLCVGMVESVSAASACSICGLCTKVRLCVCICVSVCGSVHWKTGCTSDPLLGCCGGMQRLWHLYEDTDALSILDTCLTCLSRGHL